MPDIDEKGSCNTCRKPVPAGPSSLTQWIFGGEKYCVCQAHAFQFLKPEEVASSTVTICSICDKEIRQSDGTMTQWIFQSRYCSCASPSPQIVETGKDGNGSQKTQDYRFEVALSAFEHIGEESIVGWRSELERYQPLRKLGQGGAGSVFLCQDTLLNKLVAVKFLRLMTPKLVVSFQMEAKIASRLDHPGIVRIIDFGITDSSVPYMVMEPVCGVSLKDGIKLEGPLDESDVRTMAIRLCRSLAYAHRCGTFHRDIKTSNVMILKEKDHGLVPILIDFGIAKFYEEAGSSEQSETLAGTPEYMSPDVILRKKYTEASEVYSLGCVLFEALTGRVPFKAENSLDTLAMHTNAKPPSLRKVRSDLTFSPEIRSIVSRCLEKDPALRFQSMVELEKALGGADESESQTQAPEETTETAVSKTQESFTLSRSAARVLGVLLGLLICLVGVVAVKNAAELKEEDARIASSSSSSNSSSSGSSSSSSPTTFSTDLKSMPQQVDQKPSSEIASSSAPIANVSSKRKPRKVFLVPSIRIEGDSLPGSATEVLISSIGMVGTNVLGQRMLWKTGETDVTVMNDGILIYTPVPKHHLSQYMMPRLFTDLTKFDIQRHGSTKYLGLRCNVYQCFDRSTRKLKAEFWTTNELGVNKFYTKTCCDFLNLPDGYGFPLKMRRSVELLVPGLKDDLLSARNRSLPPPQDGWIAQRMTKIERAFMAKNTNFEVPWYYRKADLSDNLTEWGDKFDSVEY